MAKKRKSARTKKADVASTRGPLPLGGKVAVITGGGTGIGYYTARLLAVIGCEVIITGRRQRVLADAVKKLNGEVAQIHGAGGGGEVRAEVCDVSDEKAVARLAASVKRTHGRIDILFNNAGVMQRIIHIDKLDLKHWYEVMEANLTGTFLMTRAALPLMGAGGTIINNISVSAYENFAGGAAYNAAKAGALSFTRTLRNEVRERGIRVVAVVPGATDTPMWEQFWADAPREKMVHPAAVADAVVSTILLPGNAVVEEIRIAPTSGSL